MARLIVSIFLLIFMAMSAYAVDTANSIRLNLATINHLTKQKGRFDSATNVYCIVVPRDDLDILVNGMRIPPDLLTSWVSFGKAEELTTVVGDLILLQDQVNPVMTVALKGGLEVTDLHNPFLWESPRVMLMHIKGIGDEKKLASAVGNVFDEIHRTMNGRGDFPLTNADFSDNKLNPGKIKTILGVQPSLNLGSYKVVLSPDDKSAAAENPNQAQIHIWAAFTGSDSEAMVDGNIALRPANLQSVLTMLRDSHVYVLSIYQHTIDNDPNYIFIHYWGLGRSDSLAKVLHKVMAETKKVESPYNLKTELALTQNNFAYAKKFTKDLYPNFAATPTSVASHAMPKPEALKELSHNHSVSTDYIKAFTLGLSSALLTAQEKMYGYTKSLAANVAYAAVVAYSNTHKQNNHVPVATTVAQVQKTMVKSPETTVGLNKPSRPVKVESLQENMSVNTALLSKDVSKSMNIPQSQVVPGLSYSLLPQLLITQVRTYLYANTISQPIIQSEKSKLVLTLPAQSDDEHASVNSDVLVKELSKIMCIDDQRYTQAEISNEFLREILASQSKNYSYWNLIIKPLPIPVQSEIQPVGVDSKIVENTASVNSTVLVAKVSQAMAIDNQTEISNGFLRSLLVAQAKNYSYWNLIIKPLPIPVNVETAKSETVANDALINSELLIAKLSMAMAIDTSQYKKADPNNFFLQKLLIKHSKDYSYASLIIKPLPPVSLDQSIPAPNYSIALVKQLAVAMAANTNQYAQLQTANQLLYKLLLTQNKNYSYSHLIIWPLPAVNASQELADQSPRVVNADLLTKKVSHALYMRYRPYTEIAMTNPLLHDLLVAQNKSYSYKKWIILPIPVAQENNASDQKVVAQNASTNMDVLSKRLARSLYIASTEHVPSASGFLQVLLVAQNKDYSYAKIFDKALSMSDDTAQSTKKAQAEVKKLAIVKPVIMSPMKSTMTVVEANAKLPALITPPMNISLKPVLTVAPNNQIAIKPLKTAVNSNIIPVLSKAAKEQVNAKPLVYAEHVGQTRTADELETRIKPSILKNHSVKVDVIPLSAFGQTAQHKKTATVTQLAANTSISQKSQINTIKPVVLTQNAINVTVKPVLKVTQKPIKPTMLASSSVIKPVIPVESKRIVIKPSVKSLAQHKASSQTASSTVMLAKNNQDAKAKELLREMSDSDYINQYKKQIQKHAVKNTKRYKNNLDSDYAKLTEPHDYVPKHTRSMSGRRIDALWDNAYKQHAAPVVAQHKNYQVPSDLAQQDEAPARRAVVDDYTSSYEWQ